MGWLWSRPISFSWCFLSHPPSPPAGYCFLFTVFPACHFSSITPSRTVRAATPRWWPQQTRYFVRRARCGRQAVIVAVAGVIFNLYRPPRLNSATYHLSLFTSLPAPRPLHNSQVATLSLRSEQQKTPFRGENRQSGTSDVLARSTKISPNGNFFSSPKSKNPVP